MADEPIGILVCRILFVILGLIIIGVGLFDGITASEFEEAPEIFILASVILTGVFMIIGVAELAVAYGIWKMKKWARIAGIILAIIGGVLGFPIGTIISIVILYLLLMNEETKNAFL